MSNKVQRNLQNLKIWINDIEITEETHPNIWCWIVNETYSFDSDIGVYYNFDINILIEDMKEIKEDLNNKEEYIIFYEIYDDKNLTVLYTNTSDIDEIDIQMISIMCSKY